MKPNYPMDTGKVRTTKTGYKQPTYADNQGAIGGRGPAASKAQKCYNSGAGTGVVKPKTGQGK